MSSAAPCALAVGVVLPRAMRRALPKRRRNPWARQADLGLPDVRLSKRSRETPHRSSPAQSSASAPRPSITVRVAEDTHQYARADGSTWFSGGYAPITGAQDAEHQFLALGRYLSDPRVLYCKIAGAQHYPTALQGSRLQPGSTALLRPEPENPYDANAVAVWDASGLLQAGYIPADHSANIAARIAAGERLIAFVLREIRRGSRSGPRVALHALVMPAGELHLSIVVGVAEGDS